MWDLLFGTPKRRCYKFEKNEIKNQLDPSKNKFEVSDETKISIGVEPRKSEIAAKRTIDIYHTKAVKPEGSQPDLLTAVNLSIFDNLVIKINYELGDGFIGSFLAEVNGKNVLKSWLIEMKKALMLSSILPRTNHFLVEQNTPKINSFTILSLNNNVMLITIKLGRHQLVLLLNSKIVNVGYIIDVLKPIIGNKYKESLKKLL